MVLGGWLSWFFFQEPWNLRSRAVQANAVFAALMPASDFVASMLQCFLASCVLQVGLCQHPTRTHLLMVERRGVEVPFRKMLPAQITSRPAT